MIGFQAKRTILLGLKSLWLHKLRSSLTVLGMVFGVCSVVAMLAIGEGASYEAQEQIKQLGSTNIIIRSVKPPEAQEQVGGRSSLPSYGLTYMDAERIATTIPSVVVTVPVRTIRKRVRHLARKSDAEFLGTVPWLPEVMNRKIERGRFIVSTDLHLGANVCVLEPEIANTLFPLDDPLGDTIRVENDYYRVVGVMAPRARRAKKKGKGSPKGKEASIYIPLTTARKRFGEILIERRSGSFLAERVELHELTVSVEDIDQVMPTAEALRAALAEAHEKQDYELIVPLKLLEQAREIKRTFNIVLGSIAAISLVVGGIGIMNIMLATITERTREIGIRRALGAKKRHIVIQFLSETVLLSGSGGIIGVLFGVIIPFLVEYFSKMKTIVTPWSLILAFSISAGVGIVFGIYPAYRAANMNPIEALRHE